MLKNKIVKTLLVVALLVAFVIGGACVVRAIRLNDMSRVVIGDVDFDEATTIDDAELIASYLNNRKRLTKAQLIAADVSGDSVVSEYDVELIQSYCNGNIIAFPNNHEHTYVHRDIEPTCTNSGVVQLYCEGCSKLDVGDPIPALGHSYEITRTDPTCTESGRSKSECSVCKFAYTEETEPAYGHSYEAVVTEVSCANEGFTTYTCSVCEDSYVDDIIEPLPHNYRTIKIGPSTTEQGFDWHICNDCGNIHKDNFIDKIVSDDGYPKSYTDDTCAITITREWKYNAWCYIAHLQFIDYDRFGSAMAEDKVGGKETTSGAANRLGAIFCVNGPYMGSYAIIRDGKVFRNDSIISDLGVYNSNTGVFANAGQLGLSGKMASKVVEDGLATDTFKFYNSTLVKNGNNISNPNNYSRAQRTFIATNGNPGDIYIVVAEGRKADGQSPGLTKYECAKVALSLGCTYCVMLDGGGSSAMYFNGEALTSSAGNERAVIDFLYFQ